MKRSIELLKKKLQDNDSSENKIATYIEEERPKSREDHGNDSDSTSKISEMNLQRRNILAIQKLKKRSIFNKVDRARSMVFASMLDTKSKAVGPIMSEIERDLATALRRDDCISLLHTQARCLRALLLYFDIDASSTQYELPDSPRQGFTDGSDRLSGEDVVTMADIHYFLDRTARNNSQRDSFSGISAAESRSESTAALWTATDTDATNTVNTSSSISGSTVESDTAMSDIGCPEVFASIMSTVTVILSTRVQFLTESCRQLTDAVAERDSSLAGLQQLLDANVEQLNELFSRLDWMEERKRELEEYLVYQRGLADKVVQLEDRLRRAEQLRIDAEEQLRSHLQQVEMSRYIGSRIIDNVHSTSYTSSAGASSRLSLLKEEARGFRWKILTQKWTLFSLSTAIPMVGMATRSWCQRVDF